MTNPIASPATAAPAQPDDYTRRLIAAGEAVGTDKPQLADTLAKSSVSTPDMQLIGQFTTSLKLAAANRLAVDSGAATDFTPEEQNALASINEHLPNQPQPGTGPGVNAPQAAAGNDQGSWLQSAVSWLGDAFSATGNLLFHNPVTEGILKGFDFLGNAIHMPARIFSAEVGGVDAQTMRADGYDPNSFTSRVAFEWSHPESDYHDLSAERQHFGDHLVDMAVLQQANPDAFAKQLEQGVLINADGTTTKVDLSTADGQAQMKAFNDLLNSDQFKQAAQAVDAQHISPGRDIAGLLVGAFGGDKSEANGWFSALSGTLDAAYDWFMDPTLALGKLNMGMRAADVLGRDFRTVVNDAGQEVQVARNFMDRHVYQPLSNVVPKVQWQGLRPTLTFGRAGGLADATDVAGTKALITNGGAVSVRSQSMLDLNNKIQDLGDVAKTANTSQQKMDALRQAAILQTQFDRRFPEWVGLQAELDGKRVLDPTLVHVDKAAEGSELPTQVDLQATADKAGLKAGELEPVKLLDTGVPYTARFAQADASRRIRTLDDLADYMGSTAGLVRMVGGAAAQRAVMMQGRMGLTSELRARLAAHGVRKWTIDYSKPGALLPDEAEQPLLTALDENPTETDISALEKYAQGRGQQAFQQMQIVPQLLSHGPIAAAKAARARVEQFTRRIVTMQPPKNGIIEWSDPNSATYAHQLASLYMNRGDAAMFRVAYRMGNNAVRRQIIEGAIVPQLMHASGVYKSATGQKWAEKYLADQDSLAKQKYGMGETSVLNAGENTPARQAALYPNQLRTFSVVPTFKELHYNAGKFSVGEWAQKAGLASAKMGAESNAVDKLMEMVKLGWITTAASGFRNAIEESATAIAKGMGPDMLRGRLTFSKVTKDVRAERRAASATFLRDYKAVYGDTATAFSEATRTAEERVQGLTGLKKELDTHEKALAADKALDLSKPDNVAKALSPEERAELEATVERLRAEMPGATEEARKAVLVTHAIKHRVPLAFRWVADKTNDVFLAPVLGRAMRVFGRYPTEQEMQYARDLVDSEITSVLREGVFQSAEATDKIADAMSPMAMHRAGVMARKYRNTMPPVGEYLGWREVEADGGQGADLWAKRLGLQYNGVSPAHAFIQAMKETNDPAQAEQAVRAWLDSDEAIPFVRDAEHANTLRNGARVQTVEDRQRALDDLANRQTADLLLTITKRGIPNPVKGQVAPGSLYDFEPQVGGINEALLDRLTQAKELGAPDASWLTENVPAAERPEHVIGQQWAPFNPAHGLGKFPSGYTQFLTKVYGKVAVDFINATTRNPLFTGLYINARKNVSAYEKFLLDNGWNAEVAATTAKHIALSHAQQEIFKHVDNPYIGTQMSTIVRNFWAFERFQEDFVRRWGRTLRDNPDIIRKLQLSIHAGQSAGMLNQDADGKLNFLYPGSQLAVGVLNKALSWIDGGQVQVPLMGELSSSLQYINASLQNPLGFAATPLVSVPVDLATKLLGADNNIVMAGIKKAVEGDLGQTKTWYQEMLPEWANRLMEGTLAPNEEAATTLVSSEVQALFQLEAAGQLEGVDKNGLDPNAMADFQQKLTAQTRNTLLANLLFGFMAPAAPHVTWETKAITGADGEGHTHVGNQVDWSWHETGYNTLQDEFKAVVKDVGYQGALAWWTATHPGELIWDQSGAGARTQADAKSANMPATIQAARYMQNNKAFIEKYRNVAGYFLPASGPTADGKFSDIAYRAQLEAGLRHYKPLERFLPDIVIQRGEQLYHDAVGQINQGIADALTRGDQGTVRQLESAKATYVQDIKSYNPLLADKLNAQDQGTQQTSINTLRDMVHDNSPETVAALGQLRPGILALLEALDRYDTAVAPMAGRLSAMASQTRRKAQDVFRQQVQAIVGTSQAPGPYAELADLARGLFSNPSTN